MENVNNTNDILALGQKAVANWRKGEQGDAIAVYVLNRAWHSIIFQAIVEDRKGDTIEEISFTLADFANRNAPQWRNPDGTRNNKANNAAFHSIAERVFGIEAPTPALKQRIMRALKIVEGLARLYGPEAITLNSRNQLVVPYVALNDEPAADASEREKKVYAALADGTETLDSKEGRSLAALARRLSPPKKKGNDERKSPSESYRAALVFIKERTVALMNEDAPDDQPAPSNDLRELMYETQAALAAYFEADPMEKEEETPQRKRG